MKRRRSRISTKIQHTLICRFIAGCSARLVAKALALNRNTVRLYFQKLRERIAAGMDAQFDELPDRIRTDLQRYQGDTEFEKSAVGVTGIVPIFGIMGTPYALYTVGVPDALREETISLRSKKNKPVGIRIVDGMAIIDSLGKPALRQFRRECLANKVGLVGDLPITSIELFVNCAIRRADFYNGIPVQHFHLFLKECEFLSSGRRGHDQRLCEWMEVVCSRAVREAMSG